MNNLSETQRQSAARILRDSLELGWPTMDDALEELDELLVPENTLLAAVGCGELLGWGGILPVYHGRVFELHPLAVREDARGKGVGKALLSALEETAKARGGLTMWIGADDEREGGETSLAGVDLYDNLPERIINYNPGTHQSAFYLKMGYELMGVMPDANGPGKPDIFFAKRLV